MPLPSPQSANSEQLGFMVVWSVHAGEKSPAVVVSLEVLEAVDLSLHASNSASLLDRLSLF
jgi:hypothetical protein